MVSEELDIESGCFEVTYWLAFWIHFSPLPVCIVYSTFRVSWENSIQARYQTDPDGFIPKVLEVFAPWLCGVVTMSLKWVFRGFLSCGRHPTLSLCQIHCILLAPVMTDRWHCSPTTWKPWRNLFWSSSSLCFGHSNTHPVHLTVLTGSQGSHHFRYLLNPF